MSLMASLTLIVSLWAGQTAEPPAYVREGDQIEQEFRAYRERLNSFFTLLRGMIDQQPPNNAAALPRLQPQDAPAPVNSRFGFGMLPRIVDALPPASPPVSVFNYSWPITDGYIAGENVKLDQAEAQLRTVSAGSSGSGASKMDIIGNLILGYCKPLENH